MIPGATPITLRPIGRVRSPVAAQTDEAWGDVEASIELEADLAPGLEGLGSFTHALVVTYLHEAAFDGERHLRRHPRGLAHLPRVGIFAQRAKDRPNALGITAVEILGVDGGVLRVRGLDAIDGTPVLDVKPYVPAFDRRDDARVAPWMDEIMRGYF